jgi:hypothetical protein
MIAAGAGLLFKAAGALYDLLQIALRLVAHRKKMVAEDHLSPPCYYPIVAKLTSSFNQSDQSQPFSSRYQKSDKAGYCGIPKPLGLVMNIYSLKD